MMVQLKGDRMKQNITQHAITLSENGKAQALASTFTTAAGIGTVLDYLPDMLGIIATLSGISLTWIMICKSRLDIKRIKLEIEEKEDETS
jgi:hypothetical protein